MTRRHIPSGIHMDTSPIVVGSVPTHATQRRLGDGALDGYFVAGNLAAIVPIHQPYGGQGAVFPAFPNVQPSSVAPNAIRVVLMTAMAQQIKSASGHSKAKHTDEPVPAQDPDPLNKGWAMPKKGLHGTGGKYTLPAPPTIPNWPVFIDRLAR